METFGAEALLANSAGLLTEEETVCEELNDRIQKISASGDQSPHSLPAKPPLTLGPVGSSPRLGSQPLSELDPSDIASPFVYHPDADIVMVNSRVHTLNSRVHTNKYAPRIVALGGDDSYSEWECVSCLGGAVS